MTQELRNSLPQGRWGDGFHVKNNYIHLDSGDPRDFPRGTVAHIFVDVLGGNFVWYVIPR